VINNLGSFPGGQEVDCTEDASLPCECGCGCRCDNGDVVAPPGTPAELRYSGVGTVFGGSGGPGVTFDLAVTNLTGYRPWNSSQNGRTGSFAQINLGEDTTTSFALNFYEPDTITPLTLETGAGSTLLRLCCGAHASSSYTQHARCVAVP
jgi:hypothetical protein